MKVLMICGVFAKEHEAEVMARAKGSVEFSANLFQQKLIAGFRAQQQDLQVLSAPFIGAYPMGSSWFVFRNFRQPQEEIRYVPFHNLWGLRNLSRAAALKKAVKSFAAEEDPDKRILVYCPHTPFLEAAVYAKSLDPRIRICLYVPDLPDYMNLRSDRSKLYDIAKKADIARMHRLMEQVDSFVLLTEPMRQMLPVGNKPCLVREGILSRKPEPRLPQEAENTKNIVYTGKMDAAFGILQLLEGFRQIPEESYRLVLCGSGDCDEAVRKAAREDSRILALGQLPPEEAAKWQQRAAVLVNPRPNNAEYTKYSFPSKNIEYLLTGKPVVAFQLDGMPGIYEDFLYPVSQQIPEERAMAEAICRAVQDAPENWQKKHLAFLRYAEQRLSAESIAQAILEQLA